MLKSQSQPAEAKNEKRKTERKTSVREGEGAISPGRRWGSSFIAWVVLYLDHHRRDTREAIVLQIKSWQETPTRAIALESVAMMAFTGIGQIGFLS